MQWRGDLHSQVWSKMVSGNSPQGIPKWGPLLTSCYCYSHVQIQNVEWHDQSITRCQDCCRNRYVSFLAALARIPLSSAEATLCLWEKEKENAQGTMGREKRDASLPPFPFSHRPPRAFLFFFFPLLLFLLGYPAGASAEEKWRILSEEFFPMIVVMCMCKLYQKNSLFGETKPILSP